jgi:sec-independent protein translocase protein TatB
MFGVGWTEMLLIGVVALIVIGPKDLPVVMRQVGKVVGTIRRMGSEFQRELNKTTGLDQITDLRRTITEPLKQTAAEINREFNKINAAGETVPSGAIAPKTPGAESVVDEIHEKVGMSPAIAGTIAAPVMTGKQVESPAPAEAIAPVSKPRKPRAKKAETVASLSADEVTPAVAASPASKRLAKAADAGPTPKMPRKRTPKPKAEA